MVIVRDILMILLTIATPHMHGHVIHEVLAIACAHTQPYHGHVYCSVHTFSCM